MIEKLKNMTVEQLLDWQDHIVLIGLTADERDELLEGIYQELKSRQTPECRCG